MASKKRKKRDASLDQPDDDELTEEIEFCFICGEQLDWLGWCSCCSKD